MSAPEDKPGDRRRSRVAVDGLDRTPHRTFLRAMGLDDAAIAKPFVAVISTHGENTPCSMSLRPQAEAAKMGVAAAGGTPFEMTTISVSDGVSMNHRGMRMSLVSREWIADSVEIVMRAHAYDALVAFAGCDKTLPAMMMAMARLNCPSVFMYGGAMLPGEWRGRTVSTIDSYEGVGAVLTGEMSAADLAAMELECSPTLGSCPGQFTANTMAMVSETLGLALPGSAMLPAPYSDRLALARRAGETALRILRDGGPLPRDLVTRKSLENACAAVAATGGSTNAGLHLPAIAHEVGIEFTLDDVADVFRRTPLDRRPAARRQVPRARPALRRRRIGGAQGAARRRTSARRLPDALGAHARGGARGGTRCGREGGAVRVRAAQCDRRRRGAQGQPVPRRRAHQDRGLEVAPPRGPRAGIRMRGGRGIRRQGARVQVGRRAGDPQRRPGRRARHARDARDHRADLRSGHGRTGRAADRRTLFGRDPGDVHRLRVPRGGERRPDRARCATATASASMRPPARSTGSSTLRKSRAGAHNGSRAAPNAWPVCSRNTPGWSARRTAAR